MKILTSIAVQGSVVSLAAISWFAVAVREHVWSPFLLEALATSLLVPGASHAVERPLAETTVMRLLAAGQFITTTLGIVLGGGWPSPFTVVALLALPACAVASVRVVKPRFLVDRPRWREYTGLSAVASALSMALEGY